MPDNLALSGSMYSGEPCGSSCAGYVRHPFSKNGSFARTCNDSSMLVVSARTSYLHLQYRYKTTHLQHNRQHCSMVLLRFSQSQEVVSCGIALDCSSYLRQRGAR